MNKLMADPASPETSNVVYVIDPDESVHDALSTLLGASGYRVTCFSSAEAFIDAHILNPLDSGFLLVEADLSGIGGIALIRLAQQYGGQFPVVALISTADRGIAEQAIRAGAIAVLEKPLLRGPLLRQLRLLSREFVKSNRIS